MLPKRILRPWIIANWLLSACGYHVQYLAASQLYHPGVVLRPLNPQHPQADSLLLHQKLHAQLSAHQVRVVDAASCPQCPVLQGNLYAHVQSSSTRQDIEAYGLRYTAKLSLQEPLGKVLWNTELSDERDFLPVLGIDVQPILTETNREFASHRSSQQLAERIVFELLTWQRQTHF